MKKLIAFLKDRSGAISVEFALISPMLIFSTMYSANMGYKVHQHQKLTAATNAATMYLQDHAMNKDLSTLRPVYDKFSGKFNDSNTVLAVKGAVQAAYGDELPLESIQVETVCACQAAPAQPTDGSVTYGEYDFEDQSTQFYKKQTISYSSTGEVCPFNCPGVGGRARVLVEVNIRHTTSDFFSDDVVVTESITTRLR